MDSSTCCLASSDYIDAELETLAVHAWRSLDWICGAHFLDELARFQWYRRPATMSGFTTAGASQISRNSQ
jgi:hypothetical protein